MAKQSRREFLEQSLFAATLAATAGMTGTARADQTATSTRSPNETLRIAVLGVRGRGQSHLQGFLKRKDCDVVAVVDPDEAVLQSKGVEVIEKKTGRKPKAFRDLRQMLGDKEIDVISIATPNHWHALAAIWGIQAGKDVYVEKPVSHNVLEGRRTVQAARKYNKIVQTGTQCRSNPTNIEAVEFIRSGGIGEVKLARGLCYKRRPSIGPKGVYDVPASVDYHIWLGPAPDQPLMRPKLHYDWHWVWETGNGDLGNQGIHQMDIARWGLGVDNLGTSVLSYGGRFGYEDAGETANTQVCIHEFDGGKRLEFEVRGLPTDKLQGASVGNIFYGDKGTLVLTSYSSGAAFDLDGNIIRKFSGGSDQLHFDNFVEAVRARNPEALHADIEEGHLSSALCHLGNISYRMGERLNPKQCQERLQGKASTETYDRFVAHLRDNDVDLEKTPVQFGLLLALDGEKEVFVGDHARDANTRLTRESYRKDFVLPTEAEL